MSKSESRAERKMIGSPATAPQVAAQREAAVDVVAEADVDQREVRQAGAERGQRSGAVVVGRHHIALARQHVGVVGADRRLVLDDGDAPAHLRAPMAANIAQAQVIATARPRPAILLPPLFAAPPLFAPAGDRVGA
jgi:hypothetical protein